MGEKKKRKKKPGYEMEMIHRLNAISVTNLETLCILDQ